MSIKVRARSIVTLPKRLPIIDDLLNDLVEVRVHKSPPLSELHICVVLCVSIQVIVL